MMYNEDFEIIYSFISIRDIIILVLQTNNMLSIVEIAQIFRNGSRFKDSLGMHFGVFSDVLCFVKENYLRDNYH